MSEAENDLVSRLRRTKTLMNVRQLAKTLSVSEQLIYKLAAKGRIPSIRVAGVLRFDSVELASWVDKHKMPPVAVRRWM